MARSAVGVSYSEGQVEVLNDYADETYSNSNTQFSA